MSVTELELRISTVSALERKGIKTILDLLKTPEQRLWEFVGQRRNNEIQQRVQLLGLTTLN